MRTTIAALAVFLGTATPLAAEELTFRCKSVVTASEPEVLIDTLKVDVAKQEISLLVSATGGPIK